MIGMGELVVVTGPPGAGKSTVARALSGLFEASALVAGDDFFAFIDRSFIAPWTTEAHDPNTIVIEAAPLPPVAWLRAVIPLSTTASSVPGSSNPSAKPQDWPHSTTSCCCHQRRNASIGSNPALVTTSRTLRPLVTCTRNSPRQISMIGSGDEHRNGRGHRIVPRGAYGKQDTSLDRRSTVRLSQLKPFSARDIAVRHPGLHVADGANNDTGAFFEGREHSVLTGRAERVAVG
jgi:energy-coupling factor transporter ATP-binding protein EcfA2